MRFITVIIGWCLVCLKLNAQDRPATGRVYELDTRRPLAGITVNNPGLGRVTTTDSTGFFRLPARNGNLLIFSGPGFRTDTILVIDHSEREVFMRPLEHLLKEVLINSAPISLGEFRDPEYHGQTVVYQRDKDDNPVGGLVFRISYWNKDSRKERRAMKRLAQAETAFQIDALFTPEHIGRYVPLKGEELQNFIGLYRPSVAVYRSASFNLLVYLNEKYKEFLVLPEEKRRLPPLVGKLKE